MKIRESKGRQNGKVRSEVNTCKPENGRNENYRAYRGFLALRGGNNIEVTLDISLLAPTS